MSKRTLAAALATSLLVGALAPVSAHAFSSGSSSTPPAVEKTPQQPAPERPAPELPVEEEKPVEEVKPAPAPENPAPELPVEEEKPVEEVKPAPTGTRANPYPVGTMVSDRGWEVTINNIDLDSEAEILDANMFNSPAPEGQTYVLVNLTATYIGDDPEGENAVFLNVDYVTNSGITIDQGFDLVVAPDQFSRLTTLYTGGTLSGNMVLTVPTEDLNEGTLVVAPGLWSKKFFYTVS